MIYFRSLKLVTAGIILSAVSLYSEPWKLDINSNLTTTLNTYSDSWTGGEAGSFTWASQFLGVAERQITSKLNTKATLKLQFGQTKIQDIESKAWKAPEKSTDLIDGEELFRLTLNTWVDPFASVRAISQFLDGSDPLYVRYMNPLDLTEAIGASRTLIKNDRVEWALRLGGAARQLVERHKLMKNLNRETDITNDGGAELNIDLKASNKQNWVTLLSQLRVYEALVSSKADEFTGDSANYWRYPHMQWDNTLTLTFAKYLFKETFAAGLTYMYIKK